jgi:hypothetical protein
MEWYSLDPDKAKAVTARLKDESLPGLMGSRVVDLRYAKLPFYNQFLLYRLTNYSTLPAFSLDFLGDGESFFYLDGSEKPFSFVHAKEPPTLNVYTAPDYLAFYFRHVSTEEGEIVLLRDERDFPALRASRGVSRADVVAAIEKTEISFDSRRDVHVVVAPLYYDGALMKATIEVGANGAPLVLSREMLYKTYEPARA